ncbi:putative cfem domain-containing protein [Daldinia childiae]|uniref:putative cfem domain-containing protein n=1 Tax=Daldinia childiae TaxID=326645 RepID=UPI0014481D8B|nr:putative cfem domain-containing protein [Daldinia childiae]KAF3071254.1 putative cfem domain-containing protein [Daldinia childiae]
MKFSAILVGAAAAVVAAQGSGFPQGFPECGITCVNNMLSQASELGCSDITPSCLCTKQNFIYGVRDCATESCPDQSVAQQVIQYGSQYCASVGVAVSGIPSATGQNPTASTTVVATDSPTVNPSSSQGSASASASASSDSSASTASEGSTSGGSATQESSSKSLSFTIVTGSYGDVYISMLTDNSASGTGVLVPITTETISTTISGSDGPITSAVTSTVFSTSEASASGSVTSGTESGSVTTGVIESSVTTNGSTLVTSITTTGPASSQTSEGSSESAPNGSAESGSSTSNPAAQRTAAPAGLIAAAGLAALML